VRGKAVDAVRLSVGPSVGERYWTSETHPRAVVTAGPEGRASGGGDEGGGFLWGDTEVLQPAGGGTAAALGVALAGVVVLAELAERPGCSATSR